MLRSSRTGVLIGIIVCIAGAVVFLARWIREQRRIEDLHAISRVVVSLKNQPLQDDGYWTGDVAELYRMGVIPREVAEADVAPLKPLVDRRRPYRGYFLVAMESGPEVEFGGELTPLKGSLRNKRTFAFCVYPADVDRSHRKVYLVCSFGTFSKESEGNQPILNWPGKARELKSVWAIID